MTSAKEMFHQLFTAENRSRSAKTVEIFGWLILVEGTVVLFFPQFAAFPSCGIPPLAEQAELIISVWSACW